MAILHGVDNGYRAPKERSNDGGMTEESRKKKPKKNDSASGEEDASRDNTRDSVDAIEKRAETCSTCA